MSVYKVLTDKGWKQVEGEPFTSPGYEDFGLFLHKAIEGERVVYHISESVSGMWIAEGNTREAALKNFEKRKQKVSPDKLRKIIAKHKSSGTPQELSFLVCGLTYSRLEKRAARLGISTEGYAVRILDREAGRTHRKKKESNGRT